MDFFLRVLMAFYDTPYSPDQVQNRTVCLTFGSLKSSFVFKVDGIMMALLSGYLQSTMFNMYPAHRSM